MITKRLQKMYVLIFIDLPSIKFIEFSNSNPDLKNLKQALYIVRVTLYIIHYSTSYKL